MGKGLLSYKGLFILLLAALLLSLAPLLVLGSYSVPCADDFTYGEAAHLAYESTGSVLQAVSAALQSTWRSYLSWQGTFSAVFLMSLQPAVFGEGAYFLTPMIMLAALVGGMLYLCLALFSGVFRMEKSLSGIIALLLLFLCIQLMPSPVQGLYWYNGAVYYSFFFSLSLVCCGLGIKTAQRGGLWRQLLLCLLAVALGGGNYVSALSSAIIGVCALALLRLLKNGGWKRLAAPVACLLLAFLVNMAAPGNALRQAGFAEHPGAVEAILRSFALGLEYSLRWFSLPLIGVLLLLAPMFWRKAASGGFNFRFPGLLSLFSYCLLSAMFCPPIYAMGTVGDGRLVNIIYFAYVLLLAINCFYWCGWLRLKIKKDAGEAAFPLKPLLGGLAVCLLCCLLYMRGNGMGSVMALGELRSGEAAEYYAAAQLRFERIHESRGEALVLEPYPCRPYLLFFDDITAEPTDWRNLALSQYYGLSSVVLAEP